MENFGTKMQFSVESCTTINTEHCCCLFKEFKVKSNVWNVLVSSLKPILPSNTLLTHCNHNFLQGVYFAMHISNLTSKPLSVALEQKHSNSVCDHRTSPRSFAGLQSGFVIPICNRLSAAGRKKRRRKFSTFYAPLTHHPTTSASIKV